MKRALTIALGLLVAAIALWQLRPSRDAAPAPSTPSAAIETHVEPTPVAKPPHYSPLADQIAAGTGTPEDDVMAVKSLIAQFTSIVKEPY